MEEELARAQQEILEVVQIVLSGTPHEAYEACKALQQRAFKLANLRICYEPLILRYRELHAVPQSHLLADEAARRFELLRGLTPDEAARRFKL